MQYINEEKLLRINLNPTNFYVAIDFDKTITANDSTDSWDASGKLLGEEFKEKIYELYYKFAPIEQDYKISFEDKFKAMDEWYNGCMNLYCNYGLTQEKLEESINISNLIFRKGAQEFLYKMYINKIPVIILSAGIGNVIVQFLKNNNCYYDNIHIISNFFSFDENGKIKKFEGELIHTLNKTMDGKITPELAKETDGREYRLLLGDFIEDKKMIPSYEWKNTISIGFLSKKVEENVKVYKQNFDIVLTQEDATFNVVEELICI